MKSKISEKFYSYFGRDIIFLDLETTGIDPENDKIIEIGGVKYRGNKEIERFKTFVKSSIPISHRITNLTGIKNDDLLMAPKLDDIKESLRVFLGDSAIFAHNSEFEKAYMQKLFNNELKNKFYDTCLFSCIVLPEIKSYSLENLMIRFGIRDVEIHRALEDAIDAKKVMEFLIEEGYVNINKEILEFYADKFLESEEMIKDFVLALKNLHETEENLDYQPTLNFIEKEINLEEPNENFLEKYDELTESGKNAVFHLNNDVNHKASITEVLKNEKNSLLVVSDFDSMDSWKEYFEGKNLKITYIDKIFNYLCNDFIKKHIEKLAEKSQLTGFAFYLKILLQDNKPILKNTISPFLMFRENQENPLLTCSVDSKLGCRNSKCITKNCISRRLDKIFEENDIIVTYISNLNILDRIGKLDFIKQKKIIFDNLEYADNFYEPCIDTISLDSLRRILDSVSVFAKINDLNEMNSLSLISMKYLDKLKIILKRELEGNYFKTSISRDNYKYDDFLCHFLDLFINTTNLEKTFKVEDSSIDELFFNDILDKLAKYNAVLNEIFSNKRENINYYQLMEKTGDIKIHLQLVDISTMFKKLTCDEEKQFLLVSGSSNKKRLREFILHRTGLDTAGEFEYSFIYKNHYSGPSLLIPEDIPELNVKNPKYLNKLKIFILKIVESRPGKIIIIMNSMSRMKKLAKLLEPEFDKNETLFLQQHYDGGKKKLLRVLNKNEKAVIIGSQAFYNHIDSDEGVVDTIIIEKPPFPFFKDELVMERRQLFRDKGFDDFNDFIVPQTVLKISNSLRRMKDDGLFVIADNNIANTNYFRFLLDVINPIQTYSSLGSYLPYSGGAYYEHDEITFKSK